MVDFLLVSFYKVGSANENGFPILSYCIRLCVMGMHFVGAVTGEAEHIGHCTLSHCAYVQDRLMTVL